MTRMFNPPHPGAMIAEELDSLGMSAREFARYIGVAPSSVTRILNEKGPITPDMAVRIAAALKAPDADMWHLVKEKNAQILCVEDTSTFNQFWVNSLSAKCVRF